MKRIEIYINSKGNLTIDLFKNYEDETMHSTYSGNNAYELIRNLSSNKLIDVVENKIRDNVSLEYKDYIVILNEPNILLERRGLGPLIKSINTFYEEESKKVVKNKKVTRKNKFSGKKMVAIGLAVVIMGTVASNYFKDKPVSASNTIDSFSITEETKNTDDDKINLVFKDPDEEKESDSIFVDYGDRSSTEKAYITKSSYGDLIEKYAKQYGLDPTLVLGIAIQERGMHSEKKDIGGATGLMQIQNSVWENEYITAYNYETGKTDKIYVTKENIKDINNNIKFGCMYLQNCMEYMDYNVIAAVQCYNMGYGNVMKVLKAYSKATNQSVKEILSNPKDTGWLEYRKIIDVGDREYIEHVFSWMGPNINIENKKVDNSNISIKIVNQAETKNISLK